MWIVGGCMILQTACAAASGTVAPESEPTGAVTKDEARGPVQPPPTLRGIAFASTEDQVKESHPVFAAGAAVGCRTLPGFTCGYELDTTGAGVKTLFVIAPSAKIRSLTDPWGERFVYYNPSRQGGAYDLLSKGADRQEGTDDDIQLANREVKTHLPQPERK